MSSNSISHWKKQFLSNATIAFEPAKVVSKYQKQIDKLKEQNDELAKLPKTRQCELLQINRSLAYYKIKPLSAYNLNILNKILAIC